MACFKERIISGQIEKLNLPGVKRVIAVASGKGGVGKSTVASNLALAMVAEGFDVGLLDADIYGPSVAMMMGAVGEKPTVVGEYMQPVVANGVQCMSMGFVAGDRTPAVWRGPMASGALQQLLTQTAWQGLDYLIVDMPPGTGDIQLTLAQRVPITGAVIVTTPQDIALLDARKGIEMFNKVQVPVLGVIENMSMHRCSNCGHEEAIFGEGGGDAIAAEYGTRLLARLPLSLSIREQADSGQPTVVSDPESETTAQLRAVAIELHVACETIGAGAGPKISIVDD